MTPALFAGLSVAGGIGAAARLLLDGLIRARLGGRFPTATTVINGSGSLLLGLITGLATGPLPTVWAVLLGTGFLGGYTTFSTASFETIRLLQERRLTATALNGIGMLIASTGLAVAGYLLGRTW